MSLVSALGFRHFFTLTISGKDVYGERLTMHHLLLSLRWAWQRRPWDNRNVSFSSKSAMLQMGNKPDGALVADGTAAYKRLVLDHVFAML